MNSRREIKNGAVQEEREVKGKRSIERSASYLLHWVSITLFCPWLMLTMKMMRKRNTSIRNRNLLAMEIRITELRKLRRRKKILGEGPKDLADDEDDDAEIGDRSRRDTDKLFKMIEERMRPFQTRQSVLSMILKKRCIIMHKGDVMEATHLEQSQMLIVLSITQFYCGSGRTIGNKGGVGLRIRVYDRIMCFVSCHLAAHLEAITLKNSDFNHICRSMVFFKGQSLYTVAAANA